jgi:hypothetical protein
LRWSFRPAWGLDIKRDMAMLWRDMSMAVVLSV